MCGIAGTLNFSGKEPDVHLLQKALGRMSMRGPDAEGIWQSEHVALGHRRLSILDTSDAGNQPFVDPSGRYALVFNGEFFNFQPHKNRLEKSGVSFCSQSDTEVLLHLLIEQGPSALSLINGFFALAFYDAQEHKLLLARDRFGVKPLYYEWHNQQLLFGSELKVLRALGCAKEIDQAALGLYFHLHYIPEPRSIYQSVRKLKPGHFITLSAEQFEETSYYSLPSETGVVSSPKQLHQELRNLLDDAVQLRMISDVPLGCFLSGGIDSSIVTALAARHTRQLNTFSVGFRDEPFYDETRFAELVAKKNGTHHTVFRLSNQDLFDHVYGVWEYLDEPFADSSALNMFILSKLTKQHVTVALSGDGADEVFGGYRKHRALLRSMEPAWSDRAALLAGGFARFLPKSRGSALGNLLRKMHKYQAGAQLPLDERYWAWAGFMNDKSVAERLKWSGMHPEYMHQKQSILAELKQGKDPMNRVLKTDVGLLLPGDMLPKVDRMSMANSLEVRNPFLDYRVVDWAFRMPSSTKLNAKKGKLLLLDTFQDLLPEEILNRGKKGFEVPLVKWLRSDLAHLVDDWLSRNRIQEQGLFDPDSVAMEIRRLRSSDPDDSPAKIWALLCFQYWWMFHHNA